MIDLAVRAETWPLNRPFRISRGMKTAAEVVVVEARDGGRVGCGEAVPYARYGESVGSVLEQIGAVIARGGLIDRAALQAALPAGAARNALDCALWDLEAKANKRSVRDALGLAPARAVVTAVTVSLDEADAMAEAARALHGAPLLKVKVDAHDPVRLARAVREAAPAARLIVDPNESWSVRLLRDVLPALAALDVALIEQPVPVDEDEELASLRPLVPICADESAHTTADLARVAGRYQAVNIKLDKAGGLTEALAMRDAVRAAGLKLMVGCMVCTSLSIAPALLLAGDAAFVDLDGPWWLANDRAPAVKFRDGWIEPPVAGWGAP